MGAKFFHRDIDLVYFVNNKLISNNLINQKDRVLLSFSGGQDSICFVFILNQLYCQLELDIMFFWCHHLWQTDSFSLMQQIAKLSFLLQFNSCFAIPLNFISSELLARKWRQSCSYQVSLFYNYSKICLAHTLNDKVENIFLNFMRGTGLIGLSPLRWIQSASPYPVRVKGMRLFKPNITSKNLTLKGYISQHNYLNHLNSLPYRYASEPNELNMCIPQRGTSMQENSDKLKNLTKKVIRKRIQKGFMMQRITNSTNLRFVQKCKPFLCLPQRGMLCLRALHAKQSMQRKVAIKARTEITNECKARLFGAITFQPVYDSQSFALQPSMNNNRSVKRKPFLNFTPKESKIEGCKASLCNSLEADLFLHHHSSEEDLLEEGCKTKLYKLPCVAKEPQRGLLYKYKSSYKSKICKKICTCKEISTFNNKCKFPSKMWRKQLIDECYIVRPLLSISRIELNKICYFWELPIYPDTSNQKVKFFRNRVRRQLLPTIKLFFNLNIENIFLQLAKIVETEDYCLTQIVNEFTKNTDVYHIKMNIDSKIKK